MKALRFGLLGKKLSHSFSPAYFAEKFRRLGLPHTYELFELDDISRFNDWLAANPDVAGFNVTIPYKEEVIPFLNLLDRSATESGAVNTVRIHEGKLWGFNTDVKGFSQSLSTFYPKTYGRICLILGTGGASQAVRYVLSKEWKPSKILLVSRKEKNSYTYSWEEMNNMDFREIGLIVNATPIGMYPAVSGCPDLPWFKLGESHYLFDLVYNPEETNFLRKGREKGCHVRGGLEMLHLQADAAWEIWQGHL